jgi:hypothetical protein
MFHSLDSREGSASLCGVCLKETAYAVFIVFPVDKRFDLACKSYLIKNMKTRAGCCQVRAACQLSGHDPHAQQEADQEAQVTSHFGTVP